MTEYDYSPEAAEAYQKKLNGVGRWAHDTSRFNRDFTNPFQHTPSAHRRRLESGSSDSDSDSDSDSGVTSISRRRPNYPKSLTAWPDPHSRPPLPQLYVQPRAGAAPPLPALGQRPPPTRSNTLPNQVYAQQIQQVQQPYPYPAQRPMAYYPAQQQAHISPQPQPFGSQPYFVPHAPKRANTTPSKPVIPKGYQFVTTPGNSPVTSPYATPNQSPYGSTTTYQTGPTSPRTAAGGKNWFSRMFGALSIRGRSSSPAPTGSLGGSSHGQVYYEQQPIASRQPRSRSLEPTTGYRNDRRERDRDSRDGYRSDHGHKARRSRSTRTSSSATKPHSYNREIYSDEGRSGRRRSNDRERMHHRRSRSHFR
ncbi:hypothetical protein K435DRAFT_807448 [Dendrothele bispora CBS 962.96]|uniref:Uncharacterized protein n=1 Tax=Dendrothele bispora (strain CBS 962.96) TaxID=1314807 RepID=A0A4S8L591_DENBC|nr:hypothetical protein K435DRAFT_807448 [Dendrothele bispora CBS 962.96]